jgi:4-amino-4-deoxychorismate lyase
MYGDGVFRTLKMRAGKPLWWEDHYRKLKHDCTVLDLLCPEPVQLLGEINALVREWPDCVVKIIVTRGEGTRGYAPPAIASSTRIVTVSPLPDYAQHSNNGAVLRWCKLRLSRQPALAGIKHLNRLENILARKEWNDSDIAEGLLCDDTGAVIGGTMTNVFTLRDGCLYTPDLSQSGIEGVARLRVLRAAKMHEIETKIQRLAASDVLSADAVFLSNSIVGIWHVAQLDDRQWHPSGWTEQLKHWIDETD